MDRKMIHAPASPDAADLIKSLHLPEGSDEADEAVGMLNEAAAVSRPCAVYAKVPMTHEDGKAIVNGVTISQPFLVERLAGLDFAVAYVATCGLEAEEWSMKYADDPLLEFVADTVKLQLLSRAQKAMTDEVFEKFYPDKNCGSFNPGSIKEWPISEEETLFAILGGREAVKDAVGVTLAPSWLMLPSKSTSGLFFRTEEKYENCMFCEIENCPNRRAPRML